MPSDLQVLMQEAVAAHQRGDFPGAEARYRRVLRENPAHADATHFLGLLAHQTGHDDAALELLQRAIELGSGSPLYRHNLAGVLQALGRHAEAERRYREALNLKPDYAEAVIGLAKTCEAQGRSAEALPLFDRALQLAPHNHDALLGRGEVLAVRVQRNQALDCYRQARALSEHDSQQLQRVGLAFHGMDAHAEARACFEAALILQPDFVEAHNSLGITLGDMGDLQRAEAEYREALRLKPDHVSACYNLSSLIRLLPADPLWPLLMAMEQKLAQRPVDEQILLHFALGKIHEDNCDYDRAFEHFLSGNRLQHARSNYDASRQADFYRDCMRYFDSPFMGARSGTGTADASPIFIVGMSRSGTTLVEQILASHPQVYGAGEMHLLRRCAGLELEPLANEAEMPQRLVQLERVAFTRIGERYAAALKELAPDALRVTDKLPGNMALVGLMHLAFPHAHIIHCVRDPLDTCVSCFTKHFATGHDFSYDLRELGGFYRLYQELMHHWRAVLPPGRMLEVRYEEVVNDLEREARRLVAFCGLDWDDACLRFHEHRRTVRTASLAQVRRPIYASSVGRWRHYEKYLDPLKQALAGN
ncbi:MAG TPA: sulfotransferase [Gammaproteobacteria bacterium]|nr:sulfotransferase [Gammaproteobacteria bacterium]